MPVPLLQANNVIQATLVSRCHSQTLLNVLHYQINVPPSGLTYEEQMLNVANALITNGALPGPVTRHREAVATDVTLDFLQVQRVFSARSPYFRRALGLAGLEDGTSGPPNVALSITKRTVLVGRGRSGHYQLGGIAQQEIEGGFWSNNAVNNATNIAIAITSNISLLGGGGMKPVLWSPQRPAQTNDINLYTVRDEVRTMHRRTVGLGI